jgi:hypothetical protein
MPSASDSWIRRLHTWAGLYFLFFTWLFGVSGLLLNHPKWAVSGFWTKRVQDSMERELASVPAGEDVAAARLVMRQLDLRGEISGAPTSPAPGQLAFRVVRPGHLSEIRVERNSRKATVNHTQVNVWGVLNMLHSFTGVRRSDPALRQNWWATGLWRLSMDALSGGLIFMVLSGIYLWYRRSQRRLGGIVALAFGIATLTCFLFGF